MVKGLDKFKTYFEGFEDQYVLIGGTACDIIFDSNDTSFRPTRDLDIVIIVEALTQGFYVKFWEFIKDGKYRNKLRNNTKPQFYRFDKPIDDSFPKMIELFCGGDFAFPKVSDIAPVYVDEDIKSLSGILLDKDYYRLLLNGRIIKNGFAVLRPEYLILFKIKAYIDLKANKDNSKTTDKHEINKHKRDILRISTEISLEQVRDLPDSIQYDFNEFLNSLEYDPFDDDLLEKYNIKNNEIIKVLREIFPIIYILFKNSDSVADFFAASFWEFPTAILVLIYELIVPAPEAHPSGQPIPSSRYPSYTPFLASCNIFLHLSSPWAEATLITLSGKFNFKKLTTAWATPCATAKPLPSLDVNSFKGSSFNVSRLIPFPKYIPCSSSYVKT